MIVDDKSQKITDAQITEYQPLVKSIAYKFINSGEPLEDLEQVGYIGCLCQLFGGSFLWWKNILWFRVDLPLVLL